MNEFQEVRGPNDRFTEGTMTLNYKALITAFQVLPKCFLPVIAVLTTQ
jgi:hypothetical protein